MRVIVSALAMVAMAVLGVAVYTRFLGGSIGRISSWFRNPFHNTAVGGNDGSLHIIGWAVDIVPVNGASMMDVASAAHEAGFPVVVNEGDHVHVSWFRS